MVGAHLACVLLKEGCTLYATYCKGEDVNKTKRFLSFYSDDYINLFNEIKWIEACPCDTDSMIDAMTGVDTVFYCKNNVMSVKCGFGDCIENIANIISALRATKTAYFYYVSTLDALGDEPEFKEISEVSQRNPKGAYPKMSRLNYMCEMEVLRALNEDVKGCVVNAGVVLGPGDWRYDSSRMFSLANSYAYYTKGVTGFVGVYDVVKCLMTLARKKISGEKFILVSQNMSYHQVMKMIAGNFGGEQNLKYAGGLKMLFYKICYAGKSLLTGRRPVSDRNYFDRLTSFKLYSNTKSKGLLIVDYEDINGVIKKIYDIYVKDNAPEIKKFYKFT
jgi:nucleoside-diphosphate-sugar epimerase